MTILQAKSPAKINLFLHVTDKTASDYHTLDSMVAFTTDIYDNIFVSLADEYTLEINGHFSTQLIGHHNIISTAVNLLKATYQITSNTKITLTKNLPISSGIGGGSGNAATAIKLLCQLWNLNIDTTEIIALTKSLGADVPMFYLEKASYINGIGEIIIPLKKFPQIFAIIINPGITISTSQIFRMGLNQYFKTKIHHQYSFNNTNELINYLEPTQNDLYFHSAKLVPILSELLQILANTEGCALSRMSGSGATCFGLFENNELAKNALLSLKERYPQYWIKLTKLN